jgi:hypothetical protein
MRKKEQRVEKKGLKNKIYEERKKVRGSKRKINGGTDARKRNKGTGGWGERIRKEHEIWEVESGRKNRREERKEKKAIETRGRIKDQERRRKSKRTAEQEIGKEGINQGAMEEGENMEQKK